MVLEKENAIGDFRELAGPTNSVKAKEIAPNSIRALYGTDGSYNAVHGSASPSDAEREIKIIFGDSVSADPDPLPGTEAPVKRKSVASNMNLAAAVAATKSAENILNVILGEDASTMNAPIGTKTASQSNLGKSRTQLGSAADLSSGKANLGSKSNLTGSKSILRSKGDVSRTDAQDNENGGQNSRPTSAMSKTKSVRISQSITNLSESQKVLNKSVTGSNRELSKSPSQNKLNSTTKLTNSSTKLSKSATNLTKSSGKLKSTSSLAKVENIGEVAAPTVEGNKSES
jgi:hypothetical protein